MLTSKHSLTIFTLVLVLIILFFGLRPTTWPNVNELHWLPEKKALLFHHPGFAYVNDVATFHDHQNSDLSIQMLIASENLQKRGFKPIVMLHAGADSDQLAIWQYGASIIVMNGDDYNYSRRLPRISTDNVLESGEPNCITITSGSEGTRMFSNGTLVRENSSLHLKIPDNDEKLRLILGNSVYGNHSWEGEIYGLALYDKPLSPERISRTCERWTHNVEYIPDNADNLQLLFTFEAVNGDRVTDRSGNNQPLLLPFQPITLKQSFLVAPWQDFSLNRNFLIDIVLNLVGFIPLGAVLCARLRFSPPLQGGYVASTAVLFCFFLSLNIELLQGWLPDRTSSMLDLIFNTVGAWLGVMLFNIARANAQQSFFSNVEKTTKRNR